VSETLFEVWEMKLTCPKCWTEGEMDECRHALVCRCGATSSYDYLLSFWAGWHTEWNARLETAKFSGDVDALAQVLSDGDCRGAPGKKPRESDYEHAREMIDMHRGERLRLDMIRLQDGMRAVGKAASKKMNEDRVRAELLAIGITDPDRYIHLDEAVIAPVAGTVLSIGSQYAPPKKPCYCFGPPVDDCPTHGLKARGK